MRKRTTILLIIVLILLFCVIGVYSAISMYYSSHFLKNTSINGADVSGMTASEAEALLAADVEDYRLVITGRDEEQETLYGSEFDYVFVSNGETQTLLDAQNSFAWLPAFFSDGESYTMDTSVTYDTDKLSEAVAALPMMQTDQMEPPQNAYRTLLEDGTYGIVAETEGTTLDTQKVQEAAVTAVEAGKQSLNLEMAGCYVTADITSENEDLIEEVSLYNQYASMYINYYMSGDVVVSLTSSTFMDWFSLDADNNAVFDYASVAAWVDELADMYDTVGTYEPFVTSNGETVYVESVTYGWQMDREAETDALYALLLAGQVEGRSPVWTVSALTRGDNDIGDTYVEIDYTNQRMWYYKDGQLLVETPVVTGNTSAGNASPEGLYYIVYKQEDAKLVGETYETEVNYWMPFYGNVGIHDADSWRSLYGGTIYQTNGSHGCINTPTAQAQTIYENIEAGTPVVCYSSGINYGYSTASSGTSYVANSSSGSSSSTGSDSSDSSVSDDDNITIYGDNSSGSSSTDSAGTGAGTSDSSVVTEGTGSSGDSSIVISDNSTETNRIDDEDDSSSSDTGVSTGEAGFEITITDETTWPSGSSDGSSGSTSGSSSDSSSGTDGDVIVIE
ncbi:MAG: L,D-transpeptidase/peptidoglycan binding protein [Lachnospiraceae bacterium]|nr:L,D-transpeptidase/peptidoglycan binding protein [Lachnospiraceae bacterium]